MSSLLVIESTDIAIDEYVFKKKYCMPPLMKALITPVSIAPFSNFAFNVVAMVYFPSPSE
ncbi:hypothetical protein JCM18903_977 [Psychrobacter sp. JCM 18903]|nr:hypothetical protein JCM18903_977 [Psychrobacter sp. JCM 18903]